MVKGSKIITQQPKTIENLNVFDMKSVVIEHPKTSRNKAIKQAEKVSQASGASKNCGSALYSETKKSQNFLDEKNAKRTKRSYAYKDYVSTYIVENLNYFNPELQLKYTQYAVKNKLIDLVIELKCFKFVATLVLEFEKIENDDKTEYSIFYSNSKAEAIITESDIDVLFKSIYSIIISNVSKSWGRGSGWLIHSVIDPNINISKYGPFGGSSYIKLPKELDHQK